MLNLLKTRTVRSNITDMEQLPVQIFVVLLVVGLMLVGAEVFVPGGILGVIGGIALFGAIISAFTVFGPSGGGYVTIAIVFLIGFVIFLWARFFPETSIGKRMTVSQDLSTAKGTETGLSELVGEEGVAVSDLRPAGFARINGRRVDVITQGGMISNGNKIKVILVEGNRVIVSKLER